MNSVKIGNITINGYDNFHKESKKNQQQIARILTFFRQKETRKLDAFGYIIKTVTEAQHDKWLTRLKKYITLLRFLTSDPYSGKGLYYENITAYLVHPDKNNPRTTTNNNEKDDYYAYKIHKDITGIDQFLLYSSKRERPYFTENVYSEMLHLYDEKLLRNLIKKIDEKSCLAINWYNKSFSINNDDPKLKLLFLSIAFECLFDENDHTDHVKKLAKDILRANIHNSTKLNETIENISPYLGNRITDTLATKIYGFTDSLALKKWFKRNFYPASSSIRHTGNINETPLPVNSSKERKRQSIYYSGNASHEFVSNVFIAQKLFRFIIKEKYRQNNPDMKNYHVRNIENLLVADETRLKKLEANIKDKKIGELQFNDLDIVSSLNHSYTGDKYIILNILKRLLQELQSINNRTWNKVSTHGFGIINTNINRDELTNRSKNATIIKPLIELDSILDNEIEPSEYTAQNMLSYNIRQFIRYATHQLM